jgi:ATP-binding cassette, subfamily B, bacterial
MSRFPLFLQLDSMDCGPSCLRMIAKFYGKTFSLQTLRSRAFIARSGVSMLGISDAAESIGFRTRGYRLTWEQLRDEVPLPCIVHWNQRHFVVVYEIRKRRKIFGSSTEHRAQSTEQEAQSSGHRAQGKESMVYVADPASALLKYTESEFLKCWYSTKNEGVEEGTALLLEPTPDFYRQDIVDLVGRCISYSTMIDHG